MSSVKRNIVANYLGSAWNALMGLVFVPLYIHYLGIEAYGLIGIFVLLQNWLTLLDIGLTPMLSREMARFRAGTHTAQSIADLMRSVAWVCLAIAVIIVLGVALAAPWLATRWLHVEKLPIATVANSLTIIGGVIAARWFSWRYRSVLIGLERQVWLNGCAAVFATLRGLGAVAVLAFVSPSILAFFAYQGMVAALEALVLALQVRRVLPPPPQPARFRWEELHRVWHFAAGMTAIAVLSVLLTQVDKVLLSKLLPLAEFGHYTLAASVASALALVTQPICNAIYPRLSQQVARGDAAALAQSYHKFSQMLTLMIVPVGLVLALFARDVMLLWTRDISITNAVAPLLRLLVIGTIFNSITNGPYTLQLAHGWTRLVVAFNAVSVLILIPSLYFGVARFGAVAAAVIWIVINASYVVVLVPLVHRKLLASEMWRWYGQDLLTPALAALAAVGAIRLLAPAAALDQPAESMAVVLLAIGAAVFASALATPLGRGQMLHHIRRFGLKADLI